MENEAERYHNIGEVAKRYGLGVAYVTAVCKRKTGNTLNCLNAKGSEKGRDHFLIRYSEFEAWLEREEKGRVA